MSLVQAVSKQRWLEEWKGSWTNILATMDDASIKKEQEPIMAHDILGEGIN